MRIRTLGRLLMVNATYAGASLLLYRARAASANPLWDSGRLSALRLAAAGGLAVLTTFFAAWCWAMVAFNLYGT